MKNLVLSLVSAFLLAACSGGSSVDGSWILDGGATAAAMQAALENQASAAKGPEAEMAKAVLSGIMEGMKKMRSELDIEKDGTFTVHIDKPDGGHEHVNGKWTLQGNTLTMTGKGDSENAKEETHTATLEGDELRMTQDAGGQKITMLFRRKK